WSDAGASSPPPTREQRTDANGVAAMGEVPASFDTVVVLANEHAPVCAARERRSGERTIALPGALSLAGTVRVDGRPPASPLELSLSGFRDPSADWCAAARAALGPLELGDGRLRLTTGADGAFRAFGLPRGETVTIAAPEALRRAQPTPAGERAPQISAMTPA